MLASGLISAAVSLWLLSVTLSAHAQEYCPSGAVVTAQSQCPGAVGSPDNLTKSILQLNNSGVYNAKDTAIKPQKDNKSNTVVQTAQNTISHSNMTAAGNMSKSAPPSQPMSQPQIPNTIPQYPPYQQQPYSLPPYQQQPSNNYATPRILSQSTYTDNIGAVHIVGEVINESPVTAKFVKIIVTFYDAYNQVVGTDNTYTEPSDLHPVKEHLLN
jgi:hypothetical protein